MSRNGGPVVQRVLQASQSGDLDILSQAIADHDTEDHDISMCRNKAGDTPMLLAARHGHVEVLRYLDENISLSLEQANLDHKRSLHEAAGAGRLQCVQYLLKRGVQVDSLKRADWTPLMLACTKNDLSVVRELVAANSNLLLRNKDGWTPFHIACREDNEHIVEFLLSQLPEAWDTKSNNGRTPLHTAALHCRMNVLSILLEKGAYVSDEADSCGVTPLMDAARACSSAKFFPVLDMLVDNHRASVSVCDSLGRAAVHHAAQNGCRDAVLRLIYRHHGDPSSVSSSHSMTPLHYAAKEGQLETVRCLVGLGVDVNAADFKGRTALHMASIGKHYDTVRYLRVECKAEDVPDASDTKPSFYLKYQPTLLELFAPSTS